MPTTYYVNPTVLGNGNGLSQANACKYSTALSTAQNGDTIIFAAGNYNFDSSAGGNYLYNTIPITKQLTLLGAQAGVSAVNQDGSVRNNGAETVINGPTNGSSIVFLIQANNVTIDGFKTVQSSGNTTRDAFNIRLVPAGVNGIAMRENIVIKNCIVQNLRTTNSQSQAILFGESSTNVNNVSNGDGVWSNIEIANNYFDCSTHVNTGYRGIQHGTHFKEVTFMNFNIHDNKFVHSAAINSNRAIGVSSYISVTGRGPSYCNNYKIKNNTFVTPSNTAIGGFFDCDGNCEFSNNKFENCKYGISSINFRQEGGKIENNIFNVSEYAIGFNNDEYATTKGSNVLIKGNTFNENSKLFITSNSDNIVFDNLKNDNTFPYIINSRTNATYKRFGTGLDIPMITYNIIKELKLTVSLGSSHTASPLIYITNTTSNPNKFISISNISLQYTNQNGVANAVNSGYPGLKLKTVINCVDTNNNPITTFNEPLKMKLDLSTLVDNSITTLHVQKINDNGVKIGNPIIATRNGNLFEWDQYSLSTYIFMDPNATMGGAGGDPHIATVSGEHTLLPNDWKLVKIYEHNDVKVIVKCEHISDNLIENLHKLDEDRNIISINKNIHKYVSDLTYMTELSILKNNEEVLKIDMLNNNVLLHNEESEFKLEKIEDDEGLFSLTHNRTYPKQNLSSYLVHLNNNVMKVQVDNFWDDINFVKLHLFDKEYLDEYSGEFFKHDENNRLE